MNDMPISAKGLKLLVAGVVVMIAGFILMFGAGNTNPQVFDYSMFDFRRIVAAPIVILTGIVVVIIAIMKKK